MKNCIHIKTKIFVVVLFLLPGCNQKEYHRLILQNGNSSWDMIYNSGRYLEDYIQGFCFYNDSLCYAYHYYGHGKTPYHYGSYDESNSDTTIIGNLFKWETNRDTLFLRNEVYIISKADKDTIFLLTGVEENPVIILAKSNSGY